MHIVLFAVFSIGLFLIATEAFNRLNKAAVAMFAGVCCWMLYIAYGTDFVTQQHGAEYLSFLQQETVQHTARTIKTFIAEHVFLRYAAEMAGVVLFLLATTTIVEVLSGNGCFDFAQEWLKTRKPKKLLWKLAALAFLLSANLDNLVTVVLLFSIVHPLLQTDRLRRIYCTVIVLAANCGGAITAIGDITTLRLWTAGLIVPTDFFASLCLPTIAALGVMLLLLHRGLPHRIEFAQTRLPYRGDDTVLNRTQRLLMLLVGVGGLWFIPTFHRITQLPPFVGALCVLGLLWIVDELCNRQLLGSDRMTSRRLPLALQYANLQQLLFFVGLALMFGALVETGLPATLLTWGVPGLDNPYVVALCSTFGSAFFGAVPTVVGNAVICSSPTLPAWSQLAAFAPGSEFWPMLSYGAAMGGSLLATGTVAGLLLMRMEEVTFGWYLRHITPKVAAGFAAGALVWALQFFFLQ